MDTLTLRQAGERSGLSRSTLLRAIERGRLPATRIGSQWTVTADGLTAYLASRRPCGKPPWTGTRRT